VLAEKGKRRECESEPPPLPFPPHCAVSIKEKNCLPQSTTMHERRVGTKQNTTTTFVMTKKARAMNNPNLKKKSI
jgi:hypothetical protein